MFTGKPVEIRSLENYIEDWKEFGDGILIFPKKDMFFNRLFMRSRYIFMDRIFEFSALVEVVPNKEMSERFKSLFYSIVGLSCELRWNGMLLKKPHFESFKILKILQTHVPLIRMDEKLYNALNESNLVMSMLRKVRPDNLYVTLTSLSFPQNFEGSQDIIEALVMKCLNPDDITWIINMDKLISRTTNYKKIFEGIIKLINAISEVIISVTSTYSINALQKKNKGRNNE